MATTRKAFRADIPVGTKVVKNDLMTLPIASAVLLVSIGGLSLFRTAPVLEARPVQPGSSGAFRNVRLLDLPGLRRLFSELAGSRTSIDEGEQAAAWTDFSLLVQAVVGEARPGLPALGALAEPTTIEQDANVPAAPGLIARDGAAYQLLGLGYSARETADIVSGRISQRALDTARKMLMVGRGTEAAADYLDSQYRRLRALKTPLTPQLPELAGASPGRFDAAIEKYASLHGVDAAIVRAIIVVESAFDPAARSEAGAVGLMQLMPATARALGVDARSPEQNIEGGARYLSELLRMFGGLELALVAYNAGPGFARRYASGETALYGETRAYLKKVLARVRTPH